MVKEALVVPREVLFKEKSFEGFLLLEEYDYVSLIKEKHEYAVRGEELEHNAKLKQIIPYVLIIHPKTKRLFMYRRANNEKYSEVRLRNRWSCGVGGHIEREDDENPIRRATMRELQEEVIMKKYPLPEIKGYVNSETGVEVYHFGIVSIAETDEEEIGMGDGEIAEGKFMSLQEIEVLFSDSSNLFDKWTQLCIPFVKNYFRLV